jgi:phosphoglycolate phosphatase
MPSPVKLLGACLDLDGTLVSSLPDIAEGVNHALETVAGVPPFPVEAFNTLAGNGNVALATRALRASAALGPDQRDPDLIRAAAAGDAPVDADLVARCVEAKVKYERGPDGHRHVAPFPGIQDMLDELVERGVILAILSNTKLSRRCAQLRSAYSRARLLCTLPAPEQILR